MLSPNNNRGVVEHIPIGLDLLVESAEGVLVALDFVSNEMPIHDGDISPTSAVFQSKFIHDDGICVGMMPSQPLAVKEFSNLPVVHDCIGTTQM